MVAERLVLDAATELLKLAINILNTAHTTVETPQLQIVDGVVDVPVTTQREDPTFEIPQLQIVEQILEVPEIKMVQDTQTSESSGTAPVRQAAKAEIGEVVEIGALLPAEPASLVFVTAPVLEAPPVVVECVQSGPVAEYAEPTPAVTCAHTAPVVEYMTPAPQ